MVCKRASCLSMQLSAGKDSRCLQAGLPSIGGETIAFKCTDHELPASVHIQDRVLLYPPLPMIQT